MRLVVTLCVTLTLAFAAPAAWAGHHEAGEKAAAAGEKAAKAKAGDAPSKAEALLEPNLHKEKAPEKFKVKFETTKGDIVLEVTRAWSPNGADRFYNLVKAGFYEDIAFFRVIDNFMAQFGMHGDPAVTRVWQRASIRDDPVVEKNLRGYVTYAKTGRPNSRTTQLFINMRDNTNLDRQGFSPFAKVVEGMDVVDSIYKVGEGAPRGPGPSQQRIKRQGNEYLKDMFPKLDYLKTASLVD